MVHRGQDLVGPLHHVHPNAPVVQVLGHLQPDVAGADDHGPDRFATAGFLGGQGLVDAGLDPVHIADAAQHLDGGVVDTGQWRAHGSRSRAQRQVVVAFGVLGAAVHLAHPHAAVLWVDRDDLGADAHIDVQRLAQALRGLQQ